jgi:uncharacterized SAM-binding protein YcdF (DUF218 family)
MGLVWSCLRPVFLLLGVIGSVLLVLAFTRIPFDAHRWLGTAAGECATPMDHIIVLGGSGMPSGPELLRLHQAAAVALEMPQADLLVVHPQDSSVVNAMVGELVLRGVDHDRIAVLPAGDNTREQALLCASRWAGQEGSFALVTAPENMYRTIRAFQRAGLKNVCGVPAWDHASDHDFKYGHRKIGGRTYVPDVSDAPGLRYTFWNYLKLEITCLREYVAIVYYRLNGWL